jgi:Zn-dependent M32 family carboxypeptidase
MTMDKQTATDFVTRIEAHREQEQAIWQEMRNRPDYAMHEDKVVESIIDQRANARSLTDDAQSSLDSFDWIEDENGDLVPREELTV